MFTTDNLLDKIKDHGAVKKAIEIAAEMRKFGIRAIPAGGMLRDVARGKPYKDIDIMISVEDFEQFVRWTKNGSLTTATYQSANTLYYDSMVKWKSRGQLGQHFRLDTADNIAASEYTGYGGRYLGDFQIMVPHTGQVEGFSTNLVELNVIVWNTPKADFYPMDVASKNDWNACQIALTVLDENTANLCVTEAFEEWFGDSRWKLMRFDEHNDVINSTKRLKRFFDGKYFGDGIHPETIEACKKSVGDIRHLLR